MNETLAEIHETALADFNDIYRSVSSEREKCRSDRRFYSVSGAMWEGSLGEQFENKPRFEINKIHLSVIRIFNEYRNNRITVDFTPKDGVSDDSVSDICDGLFRADYIDSGAEEAFDNAFEEGVGGGIGAWRLSTRFVDEDDDEDERQRITIEPIYDADSSVYFDLGAKRQDKSDASGCFVISGMSKGAFEREYGEDPGEWPKTPGSDFDWFNDTNVYIAEYFKVERVPHTVQIWKPIVGDDHRYTDDDFERNPDLARDLVAQGMRKVREKKVRQTRVRKYILSGSRVLEDCGYIAGKHIPIIPYYGKRWYVDGLERCMGHVRLAVDAQRIKNMQVSRLGEIAAVSPIRKPIMTPEQVANHEVRWSNENVKNYPYMLVNPVLDVNGQEMPMGPVGYTEAPDVPQALAALLQLTETDIQDLLGNQQQGEELQPNISGKAVELVQNRLDMQTFIYVSNMAKSMKRCGEVWLSMAGEIYVEDGRKMKAIGKSGETETIDLGSKMMIGDQIVPEVDLSKAAMDVNVEVGPSSESRRAAVVRAVTGLMQITQDPETLQVLGSMAMMNMEGEGITEVRGFFRKRLLRLGVLDPTDEEAEELAAEQQGQKPNAQDQFLQAEAAKSQALTDKAVADTRLSEARAIETRANAAAEVAGIERDDLQQAIAIAEKLETAPERQPAPAE